MGERDRVARADAKAATTREVVDRPRDDPEAHSVELAKQCGDLARERSVHERLEEDRFRSVLALVHCDQLGEDGVGALSARTPSLDPSDQTLGPSPQGRVDEAFFCRRVQVDRARGDVSPSRDLGHAQLRVSASRYFPQSRGFDRARGPRRRARALTLDVASIHYMRSVSE